MIKSGKFCGYLFMGWVALAVAVQAERLEPVLRARDVSGTVTVRRPGASAFEPIEEGRTYPYGSRFRTAAESSVRLAMSDNSAVRVLASTEIAFNESSSDARVKSVQLATGEIEAALGPDFVTAGNQLNVIAPDVITQAKGTLFRVASRFEQDLNIVIVRVLEGVVRILGENFEVAELSADQWVSLLSPQDASFVRLKNMRGNYEVTVMDEGLSAKQLPTEEGSVLKVWQRIVPDTGERVVTAVFSDPDGNEVETVSAIFRAGEASSFLADLADDGDDFPWDEFEDRPTAERRERAPRREGDNPMPPDEFIDELVERTLEDLLPGFGRVPAPPAPPAPPVRPTPTPRGRQ